MICEEMRISNCLPWMHDAHNSYLQMYVHTHIDRNINIHACMHKKQIEAEH